MSGRVSSRRRRKVRREMMKNEIRCCVDDFEDIIHTTEARSNFSNEIYNRPTRTFYDYTVGMTEKR